MMNRFLYEYIYLKLFLCYQIFFKVRGVVDVSQNNAAVRVSAFFVEHNFCHARVAEGYIHIVGQFFFKAEQIKNHVGQKARVQNNGDLFTAAVKAQYCVESPLSSFLYIRVGVVFIPLDKAAGKIRAGAGHGICAKPAKTLNGGAAVMRGQARFRKNRVNKQRLFILLKGENSVCRLNGSYKAA